MYWLSFADASLPKGSQFLGAVIVEAASLIAAVQEAHRLGINPGGEVAGYPIPDRVCVKIAASWKGRLLTRDDSNALQREILRA